jgi:hypothetical protein
LEPAGGNPGVPDQSVSSFSHLPELARITGYYVALRTAWRLVSFKLAHPLMKIPYGRSAGRENFAHVIENKPKTFLITFVTVKIAAHDGGVR